MKLLKSINKMFNKSPRFPEMEDEWHSAGILFTTDNTVFVGYKIVNDNWQISGFGGKRNEDETYIQTAIRETLEELYEAPITKETIEYVERRLKITKVINNNGYILVICTLNRINDFILAALNSVLYTPMYEKLPYTVALLIGERKQLFYAEFHYLAFLSVNMIISEWPPVEIDPNLISDMKYIK